MRGFGNFCSIKLIVAVVFCCSGSSAIGAIYTITDLGNNGATLAAGNAINSQGFVAGYTQINYPPGSSPILKQQAMTSASDGVINLLPTATTEAFGINDSNEVVGEFQKASTPLEAFSYTAGSGLTDLGTLGVPAFNFSIAYGINNAGQIVGISGSLNNGYPYAFLYTPGAGMTAMYPLPMLLQHGPSQANAINNNGEFTGWYATGTGEHAFVYNIGTATMTDIGSPNAQSSFGEAINDAGQVAGYYGNSINDPGHAFLYTPGSGFTELGSLQPSDLVQVDGINDAGQVVGMSGQTAFLYSATTGMENLNTLIAGSGWRLISATAINNSGQITGEGIDPAGQNVAYVLTPVPEPGIVSLLAGGPLLLLRRRQR
jgi:probable HAF family extracellular repeat protein